MPSRDAASQGFPRSNTCEVDELQAAVGGGAAEARDAVHHDGQHAAPCEQCCQGVHASQEASKMVSLALPRQEASTMVSLAMPRQDLPQCRHFVHLWDRLERSFILVSATARFAAPRAMTASTSGVLDTQTCAARHAQLKPADSLVSVTAGQGRSQFAASRAMLWLQHGFLPEGWWVVSFRFEG